MVVQTFVQLFTVVILETTTMVALNWQMSEKEINMVLSGKESSSKQTVGAGDQGLTENLGG